jgi:hypothetical protein
MTARLAGPIGILDEHPLGFRPAGRILLRRPLLGGAGGLEREPAEHSSQSLIGVRTPFGSFWPFGNVSFMVPISSARKCVPS